MWVGYLIWVSTPCHEERSTLANSCCYEMWQEYDFSQLAGFWALPSFRIIKVQELDSKKAGEENTILNERISTAKSLKTVHCALIHGMKVCGPICREWSWKLLYWKSHTHVRTVFISEKRYLSLRYCCVLLVPTCKVWLQPNIIFKLIYQLLWVAENDIAAFQIFRETYGVSLIIKTDFEYTDLTFDSSE